MSTLMKTSKQRDSYCELRLTISNKCY